MYERHFTGRNCPTGYVTGSEITKMMRADIKDAIKAGKLPGITRNYSVTVDNYSGGRSIRIEARDLSDMWTKCSDSHCNHWPCERGNERADVLTAEGQRVQAVLKDIHSSYNYDASDSQVDYFNVNFYGDASIENPRQAVFRAKEKARKAARKMAGAA
jgi:antirestriction protein